jgi:hypothetical protein
VTSNGNVWDTESGGSTVRKSLRGSVEALTWGPSGKRIAGVSRDSKSDLSTLIVWEEETELLHRSEYPIDSRVEFIRWSADESRLLVATQQSLSIWSPQSLEVPMITFPDTSQRGSTSNIETIFDAIWTRDDKTLLWTTMRSVHFRDATLGYDRLGAETLQFDRSKSKPVLKSSIVTRPSQFLRVWHFAPYTRSWPKFDQFASMEAGQLQGLQKSALASAAEESATAFVDFLPHFPEQKEQIIGYAARKIISPGDVTLRLFAGSDDALRVWLNSHLQLSVCALRTAQPDHNYCDIKLRKGENTLLVEVSNASRECGFYLRLEHLDGPPMTLNDADELMVIQH